MNTASSPRSTGIYLHTLILLPALVILLWLLAATFHDLGFYYHYPYWNTMWESATLQPALELARGANLRDIYPDLEQSGHIALYGPVYYGLLAGLGKVTSAGPVELIPLARALSILCFGGALIVAILFVYRARTPWWTPPLALIAVALMTPTALRFLSSARPDAPALLLASLGLLLGLGKSRYHLFISALLLAAALLTRQTALAAVLAVVWALWRTGRPRRAIVVAVSYIALIYMTISVLQELTAGQFWSHWTFVSHAAVEPGYLWYTLTRRPFAPQLILLMAVPLLAFMLNLLNRRRGEPLDIHDRAAGAYFFCALAITVFSAMRHGSDRNHFIEPALSGGMYVALSAARLARSNTPAVRRLFGFSAVAVLFAVAMLCLPGRFRDRTFDRQWAALRSPYSPEAIRMARDLPRPLLSLDPWLTYVADVPNAVNDPIANFSDAVQRPEADPLTRMAEDRHFAAIVTGFPVADPPSVYGDIHAIWPTLQAAVKRRYRLYNRQGHWYVYVPADDAGQAEENDE